MQYRIEIDKRAVKFIAKQPRPQRERLLRAIYRLPFMGDIKALQDMRAFIGSVSAIKE